MKSMKIHYLICTMFLFLKCYTYRLIKGAAERLFEYSVEEVYSNK